MSRRAPIQISQHLRRRFPTDAHYLVGVSGGRDSVTLLHLLLTHEYENLIVCHLNHELRGPASQADARFVQSVANQFGCETEIGSTDVADLARHSRLSLETAARVARFAFFVDVARRRRCHTIFLGHHADDLVETALLNLFRGASPGGVAALREITEHVIGKTKLTIVRPLLHLWRGEIDNYIKDHRLRFREDATNAELRSTRNRIRHQVLPYIEKRLGRDVRNSIWRSAQIWMDEEALLESLAVADNSAVQLDVASLRRMPVALQRRTIVSWLRARQITNVGFDIVEAVRSLVDPQCKFAKVNLSRNRYARRRAKKIFIE